MCGIIGIASNKSVTSNIINSLGLEGVNKKYIYNSIEKTIDNLKNKKVHINNSIWIQNDNCYKPNEKYVKFIILIWLFIRMVITLSVKC